MTELTAVDTDLGKTGKPSRESKQGHPQHRSWCWTWNNPPVDTVDTILEELRKVSKKGSFQLEKGEQTGTPHFQGWIMFNNAKTLGGVKKILEKAHWEVARGNEEQNLAYTTKSATRVQGPWKWGIAERVKDPLEGYELYDWQKGLLELFEEEPDKRSIIWLWEPVGNVGKTTFAKHMCMKEGVIYLSGASKDIKCGIADWINKGKPLKMAIFDVPRTSMEYVSYQALEEVKNGIFFSGKYESGMVLFNSPHVVVFANMEPEMSKLSADRWRVIKL